MYGRWDDGEWWEGVGEGRGAFVFKRGVLVRGCFESIFSFFLLAPCCFCSLFVTAQCRIALALALPSIISIRAFSFIYFAVIC